MGPIVSRRLRPGSRRIQLERAVTSGIREVMAGPASRLVRWSQVGTATNTRLLFGPVADRPQCSKGKAGNASARPAGESH